MTLTANFLLSTHCLHMLIKTISLYRLICFYLYMITYGSKKLQITLLLPYRFGIILWMNQQFDIFPVTKECSKSCKIAVRYLLLSQSSLNAGCQGPAKRSCSNSGELCSPKRMTLICSCSKKCKQFTA